MRFGHLQMLVGSFYFTVYSRESQTAVIITVCMQPTETLPAATETSLNQQTVANKYQQLCSSVALSERPSNHCDNTSFLTSILWRCFHVTTTV